AVGLSTDSLVGMEPADSSLDSPVGDEVNGHAGTLHAATTTSGDTTKDFHLVGLEQPTAPASAKSPPSPISEPQPSPTMGTTSEGATPLESDWMGGDRPDTPSNGDLNAPSIPYVKSADS